MDHTVEDTTAASGGKTSDDNWQSTDDGRSSVAASESDMRQARNGGYILLVRPFLQDQPVAGPLDLCTYGYGVPLRPGPPASLAGGCSTGSVGRTCLHNREQNGCCLGSGIKAALAFPPSVTAMAGTTSPNRSLLSGQAMEGSRYAHGPAQGQPGAPASHRPGTHARVLSPRGRAAIHASSALHRAQAPP